MADPDFEPLHSGDEEDEFIQDKRKKDGGGKKQKNKGGQLFKRNTDKKDKIGYESSRPITAPSPGKSIQRPVQGLVGPGDTQFGVSPPTSPPDEITFEAKIGSSNTKTVTNNSKPHFSTNSSVVPGQPHWTTPKDADFSRQQSQHAHMRRGPNQPVHPQQTPQVPQTLPLQKLATQQASHQVPQQMGQGQVPQSPIQQSQQLPHIPKPTMNQQQKQPNAGPREDKLTLLAKAKLYGAPLPSYGSQPQQQQMFGAQETIPPPVTTPPRVSSPVDGGPTFPQSPTFSPPPNQQTVTDNQAHWSAGESKSPQIEHKENWADFSKTFGDSVDELEDSDDQLRRQRSSSNSSAISSSSAEESDGDDSVWKITYEQRDYYTKQFRKLQPSDGGVIKGAMARDFFLKSGLPTEILSRIWHLSDLNKDHALDLEEFCIAMHLVVAVRHGVELPPSLPSLLVPNSEGQLTRSLSTTPNEVSSSENLNSDEKLQSPGWANFESASDTHDSEETHSQGMTTSSRIQASTNHATTDEAANFRGQPAAEGASPTASTTPSHPRHPPVKHSMSMGHPQSQSMSGKPKNLNKKHSIEIARPRAAGGLVNLMDLGPGQLLPPPGGKKGGRGPPKRLVSLQGTSQVTSPTSPNLNEHTTSSQSDISDSDVVKGRSKTESAIDHSSGDRLKRRDLSSSREDITEGDQTESEPQENKEVALDTSVDTSVDTQSPAEEDEVKLRRSSSRKSRPRSYTGDSRSSVELDHLADHNPDLSGDLGHPPTPPPRAKKGHSRASSLDLNKLLGTKGGPLFDEPQPADENIKRDLSPPKKPPRTSIYREHSPDRSVQDTSNVTAQESSSKSIVRPRPAPTSGRKPNPNHRRSASLDWGKENASTLPPPKAFDGKDTIPKLYPKRAAPNPPQLKSRAKSEERSLSPRTVGAAEDGDGGRQQGQPTKPLERKMRKHELQARIRLLKEKNSSLASINNELNQELRQIMENRTSLELKTEKMKQSFNK